MWNAGILASWEFTKGISSLLCLLASARYLAVPVSLACKSCFAVRILCQCPLLYRDFKMKVLVNPGCLEGCGRTWVHFAFPSAF